MFLATLERFPNWQRDVDLFCLVFFGIWKPFESDKLGLSCLDVFLASRKRTRSNPFYFGLASTERGMSQHEADLEFSFGKDGVESHQDENAGIRFDFVLHFHVFHHENKFKPKQTETNSFE
jgi:hypothetical protein